MKLPVSHGSQYAIKAWLSGIVIFLLFTNLDCGKKSSGGGDPVIPPNNNPKSDVEFWLTRPDGTALFKKQSDVLVFSSSSNASASNIEVDESQTYQTIDGFGYTLTGGSASLINGLLPATKDAL